jgi:hypothetical protein
MLESGFMKQLSETGGFQASFFSASRTASLWPAAASPSKMRRNKPCLLINQSAADHRAAHRSDAVSKARF